MIKDFTKIILTAKAAVEVLKEKLESGACDLAIQIKAFKDGLGPSNGKGLGQNKIKEKAKDELFKLISEITHRAQINEVQLKGFIKDKLTELTNEAILDSLELNDIRAEIASLRAEITDLKTQIVLSKSRK